MFKGLTLVLALVLACTVCQAQSFTQYLALRKQNKIAAPAGVEALDTLVGSKVIEIRGVIKGSFRSGDRAALMIEHPGGDTIIVDADALPDWLLGNEIHARLLVKASREDEFSSLRASLIGAATEESVSRYEKQLAAKAKAAHPPASRGSSTSRSGLYGPIGRGSRIAPPKSQAKTWVLPASDVTPIYASFIKSQNKRLSDSEALRIAQGIVGFSIQYDVDARLIMAMVMCESGFNPKAVSRVGAMGLGQLMPGTAAGMNVKDPMDSIDNLSGTVRLVRGHLDKYRKQTGQSFDALVLSLAAYNAGAGAVKRAGGVPPYRETQNYVRKVIALYYRFAGVQ
jgi:soluble lytic murein transglycosylase-like protein